MQRIAPQLLAYVLASQLAHRHVCLADLIDLLRRVGPPHIRLPSIRYSVMQNAQTRTDAMEATTEIGMYPASIDLVSRCPAR